MKGGDVVTFSSPFRRVTSPLLDPPIPSRKEGGIIIVLIISRRRQEKRGDSGRIISAVVIAQS